jgi:hypothetical protein
LKFFVDIPEVAPDKEWDIYNAENNQSELVIKKPAKQNTSTGK